MPLHLVERNAGQINTLQVLVSKKAAEKRVMSDAANNNNNVGGVAAMPTNAPSTTYGGPAVQKQLFSALLPHPAAKRFDGGGRVDDGCDIRMNAAPGRCRKKKARRKCVTDFSDDDAVGGRTADLDRYLDPILVQETNKADYLAGYPLAAVDRDGDDNRSYDDVDQQALIWKVDEVGLPLGAKTVDRQDDDEDGVAGEADTIFRLR